MKVQKMNVSSFIHKSDALADVKNYYITPEDFQNVYPKLDDIERKSLILHYIIDNSPYAFTDVYEKPLLFEQIRQYISYILNIAVGHVKMIGSSKTGFKMDNKDYGKPYLKTSDLDFMIIDDILFSTLVKEYEVWNKAYEEGIIQPNNNYEKSYWDDNIINLHSTIERGFIDTYKMPNRSKYLPVNSKINNTMSNVVISLNKRHGFLAKKASMRVYKDEVSCLCQLNRNINGIMKTIGVTK